MTGIKILCTLFEVAPNKIGTGLNRDLQTSQGFVLEKAHAIVQRVVWERFSIDAATCIDNHIRDDSLNETLILLISRISDLETFTESVLACASVSTLNWYPRCSNLLDQAANHSIVEASEVISGYTRR